jgi:cardiolipin synthase
MSWATIVTVVLVTAEVAFRIAVALRIVMRRRPIGESLAWLLVDLLLPVIGAITYLVVGEHRLGARRARAANELKPVLAEWSTQLAIGREPSWSGRHRDARELARLAQATLRPPALDGNTVQLFDAAEPALRSLLEDIDAAEATIDLEYYIWWPGGLADEVAEALLRAARRGVRCRVLLDDFGSKTFLRSDWPDRFRSAGIEVVRSLPVGILRSLAVRIDLRNHRKIAVIDKIVGHTGSLNLADPTLFKQDEGFGQWVDAAVRVEGPAVEVLGAVFELDWHLETGDDLPELAPQPSHEVRRAPGTSAVQALPSGPGNAPHAIQQVVLTAIYAATTELVLSTPYFVPDEATLRALAAAAYGGVRVVIIVPAKIDHPLVSRACRAAYADLLDAGVEIWEYRAGLLHSKTIVVDTGIAFIGSLNMDMRSFWLNFELTLVVYEEAFAGQLRALQESYVADSVRVDPVQWRSRPFVTRLVENAVRLAGPML